MFSLRRRLASSSTFLIAAARPCAWFAAAASSATSCALRLREYAARVLVGFELLLPVANVDPDALRRVGVIGEVAGLLELNGEEKGGADR